MPADNPYHPPTASLIGVDEAARDAVPLSFIRRAFGALARSLGLVLGLAGLLLLWQVSMGMIRVARYGRVFHQTTDVLFFGLVVLVLGFFLYWGARLLLALPDLLDAAIKPRGWYALAVAYPLYFCGLTALLVSEGTPWQEWRELSIFVLAAIVSCAAWTYAGWASARALRKAQRGA